MIKNSHIILFGVLLFSFGLNAQIAEDLQKTGIKPEASSQRANPDVIFKVTGTRESHDNLILDLPAGASFEHKGEGIFHITGLPDTHGTFSIGIKAGGNLLSGVTTVDMALIARHILGNVPLVDDHRKIAADVDCDGRITVFDAIQIRRAILDRISEFDCKTNYRFIPENLEFIWEGSTVDAGEYISIKLGDVNNSVIYNSGS